MAVGQLNFISAEKLLTARPLPKAPPQVRQNVSLLRVCPGQGGGGKRRGLGPRNDVLTTCKAVTQRGWSADNYSIFPTISHSKIIFLDFLEARSEPTEEIRNA